MGRPYQRSESSALEGPCAGFARRDSCEDCVQDRAWPATALATVGARGRDQRRTDAPGWDRSEDRHRTRPRGTVTCRVGWPLRTSLLEAGRATPDERFPRLRRDAALHSRLRVSVLQHMRAVDLPLRGPPTGAASTASSYLFVPALRFLAHLSRNFPTPAVPSIASSPFPCLRFRAPRPHPLGPRRPVSLAAPPLCGRESLRAAIPHSRPHSCWRTLHLRNFLRPRTLFATSRDSTEMFPPSHLPVQTSLRACRSDRLLLIGSHLPPSPSPCYDYGPQAPDRGRAVGGGDGG